MSEFLEPNQIKEKYGALPWVSPYERIVAMAENDKVEIHEFHARNKCSGGAAWETHHYPITSTLIDEARREGARNIFILNKGKSDLNLVPVLAAAGVEQVEINDNIEITYSGLAGAGVAVTVCRGMADGVCGICIIEMGGGAKHGKAKLILPKMKKIVFGVDDTDKPGAGATWSLINEIAHEIEQKKLAEYLLHTIIQLYPENPHKTTNCVSCAATFAVDEKKEKEVIDFFIDQVQTHTQSDDTAVAISNHIKPPSDVIAFSNSAKTRMCEIDEAKSVAKNNQIDVKTITGEQGIVGAVAAIGYANYPDKAVLVEPELK